MQLRRLTRDFAHHTRCFVTCRDYRRYILSANALIRMCSCTDCPESSLVAQDVLDPEIIGGTDVQAQSVQIGSSLRTSFIVSFAMHRLMSDLFVQTVTLSTLGKIFNRRHFEIFFSFFQENRICISCKLSSLHEMSNPVFLVIKKK